jgi:hypothetical protein
MKKFLVLLLLPILFTSCSRDPQAPFEHDLTTPQQPASNPDSNNTSPSNETKTKWDIPFGEINVGAFWKDFIVALMNPQFINVTQATYLDDEDLVLGVKIRQEVRAYPHRLLDWHEIANDKIDNMSIAVTYCPLTGSGIAIDAGTTLEAASASFGVSGLLFNNNLIPYDRQTDSNWSQMLLRCVNGRLRGQPMEVVPLLETSWKTWKRMFPDSKVLSPNTGFNLRYDVYPYGNYRSDPFLLFPLGRDDTRLPRKARVHGIVADRYKRTAKAYPLTLFSEGVWVINDEVEGKPVVVAGSGAADLVVSFSRQMRDGTVLNFSVAPEIYPFVLIDQEGTRWNVLGEGIDGPRRGERLPQVDSYNAYWFAWGAIFPELPIYTQ